MYIPMKKHTMPSVTTKKKQRAIYYGDTALHPNQTADFTS